MKEEILRQNLSVLQLKETASKNEIKKHKSIIEDVLYPFIRVKYSKDQGFYAKGQGGPFKVEKHA